MFHRVIKLGIIQGGDPLSKDPAKAKLYGTGGLGVLKAEIERRAGDARRGGGGAAAGQAGQRRRAVLRLRDRSAGARRQVHGLRPRVGRHGRRAEDLGDAGRRRRRGDRAHRDHVGRRFATRRRRSRCRSPTETPEQLAQYRAVLETSAGPITIEFFRTRRRSTSATSCAWRGGRLRRHRVPSGREGLRDADRRARPAAVRSPRSSRSWCTTLQPEFNDTKHVKGIMSMARGDDPASATTSFFIVTGDAQLARRQVHGLRPRGRRPGGRGGDRADAPVNGETPVTADRAQDRHES